MKHKNQYYPKGNNSIQALYVVKNSNNEDLYGPEDFKSCTEEAKRLSMCTGKMHKVVRV